MPEILRIILCCHCNYNNYFWFFQLQLYYCSSICLLNTFTCISLYYLQELHQILSSASTSAEETVERRINQKNDMTAINGIRR